MNIFFFLINLTSKFTLTKPNGSEKNISVAFGNLTFKLKLLSYTNGRNVIFTSQLSIFLVVA